MPESTQPSGWLEHFNRATFLYKAGRLDEAIDAFKAVLLIDPSDAPSHFNLGEILEARGRRGEAVESYERFLACASHEEKRFVEEVQGRVAKLKQMRAGPSTLSGAKPKADLLARFGEGVALYKAGRLDAAADTFRACLGIDPKDAPSHFNLAEILEARDRLEESAASYREFIACAGPDEAPFIETVNGRLKSIEKRLGVSRPTAASPAITISPPMAQAPVNWGIGEVVGGILEIRSLLGQGGFGAVHKVYHRGWGMELAVKSPRSELVLNRWALENFVQEANTWVGLGLHPHIVTCYFVRLMGVPRIFIEYMEGGSLGDWMWQSKVTNLQTALDMAIQLARAMQYAHGRGLVHRDLKPDNCLITPGGMLKVTDWGLAKVGAEMAAEPDAPRGATIAKSKGATLSGKMGTPEYMSPEQWENPRLAGPPADIWAFGVILYELCYRRRPFDMREDEPVDAFYARLLTSGWAYSPPKGLPDDLARLITSCISPEPSGRPADFKAIGAILESAYTSGARVAYPREVPKEPPLLADTLVNQGVSLADLARSEEALKLFDNALKIDPMHPGAIYDRGLLLCIAGQMEDSELIGRLERAKRARPKEWAAGYLLGLAHLRAADAPAAGRELTEAAELSRDNPVVLRAKEQAEAGDRSVDFFVALPHGAEGAGMGDAAFRGLMKRAEAEWAAGRAAQAYETVMRARGVKGYENAAAALALIRTLGARGRRRSVKGGWLKRSLDGSEGALTLAVSSDGRRLLSGHNDKALRLWDAETGSLLRQFEGSNGVVNSVCFAPDGKTFLSGSADGSLRVWDAESGECRRTILAHGGPAWGVCLSPDGSRALSAGGDKTLHLWDLATGKRIRVFQGHDSPVRCLAMTLDGKRAVSVGEDKKLIVWDLASGKILVSVATGEHPIRALALSPTGRRALTAGVDEALKLWSLAKGACRKTIVNAASEPALCFTPDALFAAFGGAKGALSIVDVSTMEHAAVFEDQTREVAALCFSADGSLVFAGGPDGVHCWELDWEFTFPEATDWDEGARPFVEAFLAREKTPAGPEQARAMLDELGRRGFGWLGAKGVAEMLDAVHHGGWTGAAAAREKAPFPSQVWIIGLVLAAVALAVGLGLMAVNSTRPVEGTVRPSSGPAPAMPDLHSEPRGGVLPRTPAPTDSLGSVIVEPGMTMLDADGRRRPDPSAQKPDPAPPVKEALTNEALCGMEQRWIKVEKVINFNGGRSAIVNGNKVREGSRVGKRSVVKMIRPDAIAFECMDSEGDANKASRRLLSGKSTEIEGRMFIKPLGL